jgi:GT2 family glycosyltransferase
MDDDVSADAGWLDGFLDAAAAYADAGCITGLVLPLQLETEAQILFEKRGGFRKGFQRAVYRPFSEGKPFYPCFPGPFGTGANMTVRRDVVLGLGVLTTPWTLARRCPAGAIWTCSIGLFWPATPWCTSRQPWSFTVTAEK